MAGAQVIRLLRRMGFSKLSFSETILVVGRGSEVWASPVGFLLVDGRLYARIYKGGRLHGLLASGVDSLTVCIPGTGLLFYYAVVHKEKLKYEEREGRWALRGCSALVHCRLAEARDAGPYLEVYLEPLDVLVLSAYPRVFRRADYALVEALVYYTKMPHVSREEARGYYEALKHLKKAIYRSTKSKAYRKAISEIVELAEKALEKEARRSGNA